jgi:hypothetical protein
MLKIDINTRAILKIVICLCTIVIAADIAWWYWSPKPVITSKVGNVSSGTFSYIYFVYYENKSNTRLIQDCQERMAIGHIADNLGLLDDPYYLKFLAITQRSRAQRAALQWLKHKNKTNDVDIDLAFNQYQIESDPRQATKSIQSCIMREQHGFRLKCKNIVVGQFHNEPLTLSMIKPLLTPEEWYQFLSFLPLPMENAYQSYLTRFLYHVVHQEIIAFFSPDLNELKQRDHDQVARRFISVKYGMAHEGIYPTGRLALDFPDTVLFNHFFAIQHRFLPVQTVQVQYSVFETMDIAKMVYNKLHDGESLIRFARQYAINDHFVKTAYPHQLSGYGVNGMPSHPEERAIIDNYLLDAAHNNHLLPHPHQLDRGVLVAQLSNLEREDRKLKYRDYQFAVRRDLTLKTLKEKYRIDVEDAVHDIEWQLVKKAQKISKNKKDMIPKR